MTHGDRLISDETVAALVKGLGRISLALGSIELLSQAKLCWALGIGSHATSTRGLGLREIAAGLGILLSRNPAPWVWARGGGDTLDLITPAPTLHEANPRRPFAAGAVVNVASITAFDIVCALALSRQH